MVRLISLTLLAVPLVTIKANPPSQDEARRLITQGASNRHFSGAPVKDIMLTEPEILKGKFRYGTEFTVFKKRGPVRCEDWLFTIEKLEEAWIISEIKRGRCND